MHWMIIAFSSLILSASADDSTDQNDPYTIEETEFEHDDSSPYYEDEYPHTKEETKQPAPPQKQNPNRNTFEQKSGTYYEEIESY